jgi:hypothetical protein
MHGACLAGSVRTRAAAHVQVSSFSKSKLLVDVVLKSEAAYTGKQTGDQRSAGKLQISNMDESGDSFVLARVTASSATQTQVIGEKDR